MSIGSGSYAYSAHPTPIRDAERVRIDRAAKRDGKTTSAWIRDKLLAALDQEQGKC